MTEKLYPHQIKAVNKLKSGNILCGGVGSGKSRTGIAYYFFKECGGKYLENKKLYIITTAKKRDSLEWVKECSVFGLTKPQIIINSWNNIKKYTDIKNSFFLFDEQRLVGSGTWVKSFLKIVKNNNWILLSATPGDTWSDYIPVFVANKFYKNRTELLRRHAIYSRFTNFPKIEKWIETDRLIKFRDLITVKMEYKKQSIGIDQYINVIYDDILFKTVVKKRWNPFTNKPIKNISEYCYVLRKIVNSHPSRLEEIKKLINKHSKLIIFYNFNYELDILKTLNYPMAEWNGHKHEEIPIGDKWIYLVQYTAGAEGWNCIETDAMVFYSQNYSYKTMIQSAGRIDRLNTPFNILKYYHIISNSTIDLAISKSLKTKKDFNIHTFADFKSSRQKHIL